MKITAKLIAPLCGLILLSACSTDSAVRSTDLRPSAIPLVTSDPFFSIWSFSDEAYGSQTVHWTGRKHPLVASVRVDGQVYRVLGQEKPEMKVVLPTILQELWSAKYMRKAPSGDWTAVNYNDKAWKEGPGAFGSFGFPVVRTDWYGDNTDIWVRREFTLDEQPEAGTKFLLTYSHDDTFELYVNGKQVVGTGYSWKNNVELMLDEETCALLGKGKNVIAAHCHNLTGGSYVDFGLSEILSEGVMTTAAVQKSVVVNPTQTVYEFECGGVDVDMTFTAPLLMDDLDLLSRPVNYVTFDASSNDGKKHDVQVYFEGTPELALNDDIKPMTCRTASYEGVEYAMVGTDDQPILKKKGDDVRIDWGYFYIAADKSQGSVVAGDYHALKNEFVETGKLTAGEEVIAVESIVNEPLALSFVSDLGTVGCRKASCHLMLAYDDVRSINYFGDELRPWWNKKGDKTLVGELSAAAMDYDAIMKKCVGFDKELLAEASKVGGDKYADLCALAYRQSIAAHKLVEAPDGEILFFSKENFSNGSIGTVDVTYPSTPLFFIYNPDLVKGMMNPILHYCKSPLWKYDFAAHDVGTYPIATGQTYGAPMPVEECGNMLILATVISTIEGNVDYAKKDWDTYTTWANYLLQHGLDPEEQLCTDDFAGHFAHNANLSIKAILGIAGYGKMAEMAGDSETAEQYLSAAREMAAQWKEMAADGDHYSLTFDRKGTWSQKYNLVWDRILGLNIFDDTIRTDEIAYYLGKQNEYGLPLDSRKNYTKTDWILWTAAMADTQEEFEAFAEPIWRHQCETVDRVPMSDWINTDTPDHVGFQARSVVGGYFMKMLDSRMRK